jgi:hypothetical protein
MKLTGKMKMSKYSPAMLEFESELVCEKNENEMK